MKTNIENKLFKYCPSCKVRTTLVYTNHREFNLPDMEETQLLRLYKCDKCKIDFSLDHILSYNARVQMEKINKRSRK